MALDCFFFHSEMVRCLLHTVIYYCIINIFHSYQSLFAFLHRRLFSSTGTEMKWSLNKSQPFHTPSPFTVLFFPDHCEQITSRGFRKTRFNLYMCSESCECDLNLYFTESEILCNPYLLTIPMFLWITQGPFE